MSAQITRLARLLLRRLTPIWQREQPSVPRGSESVAATHESPALRVTERDES